ncbi:Carbonyl reductase [NADPH] 3 [Desmophyllum pertusum]|uniref:Carbonyl reductase [NADPH] 3 n=1 Tax=Desmophyllum pertusum TaxID=174260 RepID=A0A9W9YVN0_9CNID|nr:Carbonyl reductase [NADPH] 3 [Desmophyllum pertusum]
MAGPKAPKTPDQGAETPVYLALLPPNAGKPHGEFVRDKEVTKLFSLLWLPSGGVLGFDDIGLNQHHQQNVVNYLRFARYGEGRDLGGWTHLLKN